jgi:hypothetical protein
MDEEIVTPKEKGNCKIIGKTIMKNRFVENLLEERGKIHKRSFTTKNL